MSSDDEFQSVTRATSSSLQAGAEEAVMGNLFSRSFQSPTTTTTATGVEDKPEGL